MTTLRRSVMTLYSNDLDMYSQQVRMVLAEKSVTVDILNVSMKDLPEELAELNPYMSIPTLVDRDLVLYEPHIVMEYLDERFPHPPLLPVYPVARAKTRLMLHRIDQDWYSLVKQIQTSDPKKAQEPIKELTDSLIALAPMFKEMPYFFSDEFSMVDCAVGPILWRLKSLNVKLPARAKPVLDYAERIFARPSFQASLTEAERELREG